MCSGCLPRRIWIFRSWISFCNWSGLSISFIPQPNGIPRTTSLFKMLQHFSINELISPRFSSTLPRQLMVDIRNDQLGLLCIRPCIDLLITPKQEEDTLQLSAVSVYWALNVLKRYPSSILLRDFMLRVEILIFNFTHQTTNSRVPII